MKKSSMILLVLICLLFVSISPNNLCVAQTTGGQQAKSRQLDAKARQQLAEAIAYLLESNYVDPALGKEMAAKIKQRIDSEAYSQISSAIAFADKATGDLRDMGNDLHLYVRYDPRTADAPIATPAELAQSANQPNAQPNAQIQSQNNEILRRNNYDFRRAEILDGNIGYLNIAGPLPGVNLAKEAFESALTFLSNSDALIIDVRQCPGGSADMVNFLVSYFFSAEPKLLMTQYNRLTDQKVPRNVRQDLTGKRLPNIDLYVLTSSSSASGAEAIAYIPQQFKRATVVGEKTAGAANITSLIPIGAGLSVSVPFIKSVHAQSGTNWEGVGVQPDIAVPASKALDVAQREALKKLMARTSDPVRKTQLDISLQKVETRLSSEGENKRLEEYTGAYDGGRKITLDGSDLFYKRIADSAGHGPKIKLEIVTKDEFELAGIPGALVKFVRDQNGVIISVEVLNADGQWETYKKDKN